MAARMQNLPRRRRKASGARAVWLRASRQPSAQRIWRQTGFRQSGLRQPGTGAASSSCRPAGGLSRQGQGSPPMPQARSARSSLVCPYSLPSPFPLPAQPAGLASFSWGRRSARALPRGRPWTCPRPSLSGKSKASACPCQAPVLALLALELGRGSRPWPSQASAAVPTGLSLSPGALSDRFRLPCRQRRPSHVQPLGGLPDRALRACQAQLPDLPDRCRGACRATL